MLKRNADYYITVLGVLLYLVIKIMIVQDYKSISTQVEPVELPLNRMKIKKT